MNTPIDASLLMRWAVSFGKRIVEKWGHSSVLSAIVICAACATEPASAKTDIWAMSNGGITAELYSIDIPANKSTLVGKFLDPLLPDDPPGIGWSTIAETPDKIIYVLRRYTNDVHVFSLDSTNIQVNVRGEIINLISRGSTGLSGNLDGLTAGPDGHLYFTAFENDTLNTGAPRNGLFRFRLAPANPCPLCTAPTRDGPAPPPPPTTVTELVGTFAGYSGSPPRNLFYTDLAFDPITGDLIGTGFNSSGKFIPWRLPRKIALTAKNQVFKYVDAFPGWDISCADPKKTCMEDGLAFDRLTGAMYASGDSSGVFEINRNTGLIKIDPITGKQKNIGNNASPPDSRGIGTDLAIQVSTVVPLTDSEIWVTTSGFVFSRPQKTFSGKVTIVNLGNAPIAGPFQIVFTSLAPSGVTLKNASGVFGGSPYLTVPNLPSLSAGGTASIPVSFGSTSPAGVTFKI